MSANAARLFELQKTMQIFSGDEEMFYHVRDHGPMWEENGKRKVAKRIAFEKPFANPPQVSVSFSLLDSSKASNLRVWVQSEDVSTDQFTISVSTWGDTRLSKVRVAWLAHGEPDR